MLILLNLLILVMIGKDIGLVEQLRINVRKM